MPVGHPTPGRHVLDEGEPGYENARGIGRLLAEAGFDVITGSYGGVMEGASRGAREAGGRTVGVSCEVFAHREPNPYVDEIVPTPDLMLRTRELIDRAAGFHGAPDIVNRSA